MRKPIIIFSLTERGFLLAQSLREQLSVNVELRHRPSEFIQSAQQVFSDGYRCIFICSTGIVIRALAPVLRDKYQDPAVVVLDEQGKFVIPLLSGHEGGACELGHQLMTYLDAELVITSATDYSRPVYCIGVGSDRGCPTEMLLALYRDIENEYFDVHQAASVASIDLKAKEGAMLDLAAYLQISFVTFSATELNKVEDQLSTKSEIVFKEVGCYGVAEAAALLAASKLTGNKAELVVNKKKNARATIAVARSYH